MGNTTKQKKKATKKKQESSSEGEEYDTQDEENEKLLKPLLKASSVLLQKGKMKFEVAMEGRSYNFVHCKIGVEGKVRNKKFRTKQLAFDDALDTLVDKMHEKWTIVEASENEESESSEPSPPPKKKKATKKEK